MNKVGETAYYFEGYEKIFIYDGFVLNDCLSTYCELDIINDVLEKE